MIDNPWIIMSLDQELAPPHCNDSGLCSRRYTEIPWAANLGFTGRKWKKGIPSGKRLHNYGKSPFFMGKSTINGDFPYIGTWRFPEMGVPPNHLFSGSPIWKISLPSDYLTMKNYGLKTTWLHQGQLGRLGIFHAGGHHMAQLQGASRHQDVLQAASEVKMESPRGKSWIFFRRFLFRVRSNGFVWK